MVMPWTSTEGFGTLLKGSSEQLSNFFLDNNLNQKPSDTQSRPLEMDLLPRPNI